MYKWLIFGGLYFSENALWEQWAAGSNPAAPTNKNKGLCEILHNPFVCLCAKSGPLNALQGCQLTLQGGVFAFQLFQPILQFCLVESLVSGLVIAGDPVFDGFLAEVQVICHPGVRARCEMRIDFRDLEARVAQQFANGESDV